MPRQVRIQYEDAVYHVMARGNRKQPIFVDDGDRQHFLKTLGQACERAGWRVHAWVLMENHYHFVLQTPQPTLVAGMQWLQNTYTRRFNTRHRLWGRVFGDRYKAVVVENDSLTRRSLADPSYFGTLITYLHLNPVRCGLVDPARGLGLLDYRWSSLAQGYAVAPSHRPPWLGTEAAFGAVNVPDTAAGRRSYVAYLEKRASAEQENAGLSAPPGQTLQSTLERGWYWGSQQFREAMLERLEGGGEAAAKKATKGAKANRNYRSSELGHDYALADAERIVSDGCKALGLTREVLANTRGSDPRKVAVAAVLHARTGVRHGWIAEQLAMRSAGNVSQQVGRFEVAQAPAAVQKWHRTWISGSQSAAGSVG